MKAKRLVRLNIELGMFLSGALIAVLLTFTYQWFAAVIEHNRLAALAYFTLYPASLFGWDMDWKHLDWVVMGLYCVIPNGIIYAIIGTMLKLGLLPTKVAHETNPVR